MNKKPKDNSGGSLKKPTSAEIYEAVAAPINHIHIIAAGVYRVTYHNSPKRRISSELIGILSPGSPGREDPDIYLIDEDKTVTRAEFDKYRRTNWPNKYEKGRNPENTTLGVHSGSTMPTSVFKK